MSALYEDLSMGIHDGKAWRTGDAERGAANVQVSPAVLCIGLQ